MSPHAYRNLMLLLLCMTSGIVDVIGYLGLGHVFTANMTGNIVMLGLAIGHAQGLAVIRSLTALAGFIIGNAAAASIIGTKREKTFWPSTVTIILGMECLLLIIFAFVSGPSVSDSTIYILVALLSIAMGMQTTAARYLGIAGISTTVLTNNLANIVEDLMAYFRRERHTDKLKKHLTLDSILRLSAVLIYCLGAVVGAALEQHFPFAAIWVPISMIGGIMITVGVRFRPSLLNQE